MGGSPHVRHETARVRSAGWRRGGRVADRGARAAGGQGLSNRVLGFAVCCKSTRTKRGISRGSSCPWLSGGTGHRHRVPMGGRKARPAPGVGRGIGSFEGRCDRHPRHSGNPGGQAGHRHDPHRDGSKRRCRGFGSGVQHCAAGRERDRIDVLYSGTRRQTARAAQGERSRSGGGGRPLESGKSHK